MYNQQNQMNEFSMPLLMGFMNPTKIQESVDEPILYDPMGQIVYDMRTVGTKSLKNTSKNGLANGDKKNEIDDTKSVK
ncbi:hypothetical protein LJC30_02725 [Odoribacter sp. OttesenSCG-928-L07]|nr:hypothetical protein [Odoribacter sp. OttesenSCG-928-L07]MDL2238945.1 hypothetical protein [Bacteroidales bacterium OttesenSCG-928-L14]